MPSDGIDDDQLLALGRFTWAAMKLDSWMHRVCDAMDVPERDWRISERIKDAQKIAGPSRAQQEAIAWLESAVTVLQHRHQVLHAELVAYYVGDVPAPENMWEWTLALVNEKQKSRIPFTVEAIDHLRARIEEAHGEGIRVDVELAVDRNG